MSFRRSFHSLYSFFSFFFFFAGSLFFSVFLLFSPLCFVLFVSFFLAVFKCWGFVPYLALFYALDMIR